MSDEQKMVVVHMPPLQREHFPDDATYQAAVESSQRRSHPRVEGEVDISGIEAEVLAALFNHAQPIGMGYLHFKADHVMTKGRRPFLTGQAMSPPSTTSRAGLAN